MKKTSKKSHTKDLTYLYIFLLAIGVLLAVFLVWYFSDSTGVKKTPPPATTAGQQSAAVTILPAGSSSSQEPEENGEVHDHDSSLSSVSVESGSIYDPKRVTFKIDHFKKLGLQPLEFEVFDEKGNAYTPDSLLDWHEKKMHFFVVSANLREFQHLHPTFVNGKWKVSANMPNPGTYYAYIDVVPAQGAATVLRSNLIVQKETTGTVDYPGVTPDLYAINSGYKAALSLSSPSVNQKAKLDYRVTRDGKPAKISLYLAAQAHFILLRHGAPDSFMHVHPGFSNMAKGEAGFQTIFREPGRYTVFTQFGLGSKVYTFPITFDIQ